MQSAAIAAVDETTRASAVLEIKLSFMVFPFFVFG
jgi:hypothetical protein